MTGTVLVTGAGGFIGRHLVRDLLGRHRRVLAVDTHLDGIGPELGHPMLSATQADIRSGETMAALIGEADVIFHLAAAHLEVGADEAHFRSVNVEALRSMLEFAAAKPVRRFVHCSTVGVYGPLRALPADEDTPCEPDIAYEVTKLEGEAAVRDAVSSRGLAGVILRPSWVYGPECPRTLKLLRAVVGRRFFFVGKGANLRHPLYISDMVAAFDRAAEAALPSGETIVVAGPRPLTTRELIEKIMTATGVSYHPVTLPLGAVSAACRIAEGAFKAVRRDPPFSRRSLKFFTESSSFSIEKARRLLGFEPIVDVETGLERTLADASRRGLIRV